jgi:solute:Na+ symporter, SSS family
VSGFSTIDWVIFAIYAAVLLGIGALLSRRSGKSLHEYFLSGRRLPWWLAGTSMAATSFNADTPLYVTNLVRSGGIWSNWQWWGLAASGMLAVFFFSRLWRRAHVMTDVELTELRYSGKLARVLRGFRALYFAVPINCMAMAMGMVAVEKIARVALGWHEGTGVYLFAALATVFTLISGHWGVAIADFVQFCFAMGGAVFLAIFAVDAAGGLGAIRSALVAGPGGAERLALVPPIDSRHGFEFLVYVGVMWWAYLNADGGGKIVQKMSAAKDERHALLATLWFNVAHYVLRTWPWILTALASLVILPKLADPETAYPQMIVALLPAGLRGLMVASLISAFLSTVESQLNWGASYLVNDLYRPFVRPGRSERHYVRASKVFVLASMGLAIAISSRWKSVLDAFQYLIAFGAGTGLVYVLRWFWWRINAWSEVSAMCASAVASAICYAQPDATRPTFAVTLLITAGVSTIVWTTVTLLTRPVDLAHLVRFYERVRPPGAWGPVRARASHVAAPTGAREGVRLWIASTVAILAATLLPGAILFGSVATAWALAAALVVAILVAWRPRLPRAASVPKPRVTVDSAA